MKKVYALLVCLFACLYSQAEATTSLYDFYLDYSGVSFDNTQTLWLLNSRDNPNDTMDVNFAAVGIKTYDNDLPLYYDPLDIVGTYNTYPYYYNSLTIDSLFAMVSHKNYSGLMDTIVFELIRVNPALLPIGQVLFSDTIFTNQSLTDSSDLARLFVVPNFTTTDGLRVAINIKYFGAIEDTFKLAATCTTDSITHTTMYSNSLISINPQYPAVNKTADIINYNGTPIKAQNWRLFAFITYYVEMLGAVEEDKLSQTRIAPNPAQNILQIKLPEKLTGNVKMQMVNSLGQVVKSDVFSEPNTTVDVSTLPAGLYVVQLQTGNATKAIRVVVGN